MQRTAKTKEFVTTGWCLLLFTLLVLLWSTMAAPAAAIKVASALFQDVSNAVAQAKDGDVVAIPAGNASWNSTLKISKSITLIGAGVSSTTVTRATGFTGALVYIGGLSADVPVRVSGIFFDNVVKADYGVGDRIAIVIENSFRASWGYTKIRVDHCKFSNGQRQLTWHNWAYGVVDHCAFQKIGNEAIFLSGDDNYAWQRPIIPGTANAVYIEDNSFTIDNTVGFSDGTAPGSWIYHQEGGRSVTRHNTFDATAYTRSADVQFYDCHGNQNYYTGKGNDFRGTPMVEIYNNMFHVVSAYRMIYLRGGSDLVYNNTFIVYAGSLPHILDMSEEEGWRKEVFAPLRSTWPAEDQINNSFFWNNTINGRPQGSGDFGVWNANDGTFIQENRDYWLKAPDATTAKKYPNPGFPNSGYPNRYTTITSYTPLVYPHPLVTAQGGSSSSGVPAAPSDIEQ
jgi:hypothetical protein